MGLLAPLYALAALAVVGPIVFHLIRRQPTGQRQFSSLMFLSPSPPRLTRRSRLDNLPLLLLRILAIVLIAFAFARPYLRQESLLSQSRDGRTIVLLLDTSGSMQRTEVWDSAISKSRELLADLQPDDRIALYTIDAQVGTILSIDQVQQLDGTINQQTVLKALDEVEPSWSETKLAAGLQAIADTLTSAAISGAIDADSKPEIVLVTDLQTESGLATLQGYPWPENISLQIRRVVPTTPGNARATFMATTDQEDQETMRLRIENNPDSLEENLVLHWRGNSGQSEAQSSVQVPPGQVRTVTLPPRPPAADRIELAGDNWDGDNQLFVVEPQPQTQTILFVGEQSGTPDQRLDYFVSRAPLSSARVDRQFRVVEAAELERELSADSGIVLLLVDLSNLPEQSTLDSAREFAERGGVVIASLSQAASDNPSRLEGYLEALFDVGGWRISEAEVDDFSLLADIDYAHPVFAPFADPRYNDFSKIRFWSHRNLVLAASPPQNDSQGAANVGGNDAASTFEQHRISRVAGLDDGSPLLLQQRVGKGAVWLFTAGWQPAQSGLALSSKFVPILMGMIDPSGRSRDQQNDYVVDESIFVADPQDVIITDLDRNRSIQEDQYVSSADGIAIRSPGIYRIDSSGQSQEVAVHLSPAESRLTPLDPDVIEQYGISLHTEASERNLREQARQLKIEELESKQRLWQWLLAIGLGILVLETLLGGLTLAKSRAPVTA